ncbi:MAG TPA: hypothetical protein VGO50_20315 [Pyrinomonadaceae bacterium]|nr:hypothetical protein [Pyrinomonadaceae bacterium]
MLDNAKISEDQVEVIAEAVARRSWWKNPALYIPVITAVLGSPVVLALLPAKVETAEPKNTAPQQFAQKAERRGYDGTWQSRRNEPKTATVVMASDLRKGPNLKKNPVIHLAEGAKLVYKNCNRYPEMVDEMEGKWCEGTYLDKAGKPHHGWIFTAYLHTDTEES